MIVTELAAKLALRPLTPEVTPSTEQVTGGYVSDLLSDVLANAPRGGVLVTVQVHLNVIAVAVHAELAGVIFALDRVPDESVRAKAVAEGIPLYTTEESAFDVAGRLYEFGLRGPRA